jgi:hypothetical protein
MCKSRKKAPPFWWGGAHKSQQHSRKTVSLLPHQSNSGAEIRSQYPSGWRVLSFRDAAF